MLRPVVDLNKLSRTLSNKKGGVIPPLKTKYMPFSFEGFGTVAILAMVLILAAAQGIEYLKSRRRHH